MSVKPAIAAARIETRAAWGLIGPTALLMLVLLVLPTLAVLVLSVTDAELGVPEINFLGFDAYTDLLTDRTFLGALRNTALYVAIFLSQFLCGLATVTSASRMIFAFARDDGLDQIGLLEQRVAVRSRFAGQAEAEEVHGDPGPFAELRDHHAVIERTRRIAVQQQDRRPVARL